MEISVVVPTFNRREIVGRSLETLFAQDLDASRFEIIVVVDGSTDGTADALRRLQPACRMCVIEQENRGPAAARNTGYRAAKTDLVLFVDDDMLCDPGLVREHLAAHREAGPLVSFGAIFLSADSPHSLAAECFQREIGAFHMRRKLHPDAEWQITECVFSNASLDRALLETVGGFNELFRMREDMELGVRLIKAGARPKYVSSAITYQHYERSTADLIRDAEIFAAGDVMFARSHPETAIKGSLNWLAHEPRWKQRVHRIAANVPWMADFLLAPLCGIGEVCFQFSALRNLGVRALQARRRIHWYHKVLELGWQPGKTRIEESV